jgi:predicted secreted protein
VGITESYGSGGPDAWLIKTDSTGDTIWTRTYGGSGSEYVYAAALTAGRGYVITGSTESYGGGGLDVWLVRTDSRGDTVWTRTYGGSGTDEGWSVCQTDDGGYVVAGFTESFGSGANDVWLVRTNGSGDTLWTCTYGDTGLDESYSVAQTADLGYIVAGVTNSAGAGSYDAWLIKTGPGDPTAVTEPRLPAAGRPVAGATLVRGVLTLAGSPLQARYSLVSADGRKMCELRPGDNDVQALSPGVYYLTAGIYGSVSPKEVRKIVVAR